ncbi:MAG: polyamine aminopropyltransferase [Candidatus Magnetoovum sp. WYHC-5]|nr:polyamine aminopropyltransferase [Candidatus Magnetoovum sp. WYHC-5]
MIYFHEAEPYTPIQYVYGVEKVLYRGKSKFQDIAVIENKFFGKMLLLDSVVQVTERDEFFYHEMLTHVVLSAQPNPKKVAVIGGGDGGVVREVLKYKSIEKVFLVEIDEAVVNVSKEFLPITAAALDDPRVDIKIMDGADFVKNAQNMDAIIVDSTDIIGIARSLFSKEFFTNVKTSLNDNGMFVTHTESLHHHLDIVVEMQGKFREVFPLVDLYTTPISTYPGNWWAFAVSTKGLDPRKCLRTYELNTKYYDDEIHERSFITKNLYDKLLNGKLQW